MKSLILFGLLFASNVVFAQQPQPRHQPIADCEFKRIRKDGGVVCRASASACLPSAVVGNCENELKIRCNHETVFSGAWVPEFKENPERYILKGVGGRRDSSAPEIEILPNIEDKRDNSAKLFIGGDLIRGRCELFLDFKTLR